MFEHTRRRSANIISLLVVTLLSGACTAGATPSPSVSASVAPASSAPSATMTAAATPVALPPPETTKIALGVSNSIAINQFPSALARDLGIFQKYGLEASVTALAGSASAIVQAMVAGQMQGGELSAGSTISAALTDSPLVITTVDSTALDYQLIGGKNIKSAADLKGKAIAIANFGGVSHAAVLASLAQLGLKPTDVTIQVIGDEAAQISTVVSGATAAAPVATVHVSKLVEQGLNVLVDLSKPGSTEAGGLTA